MRRLWLIFAQSVTVGLAVVFVLSALKPEWLPPSLQADTPARATKESGTTGDPASGSSTYRDAAREALPSVVHVYTTQKLSAPKHSLADDPVFRHFFGDSSEPEDGQNSGLGSGVIVSASGYVLTNYHVIEAADQIEVSLNDGRNLKARLVGSDRMSRRNTIAASLRYGSESNMPAVPWVRPSHGSET